jgi:small subunit ribosomal protein S16
MLKFKLMRFGKKRQPTYRIVVSEARSKRDGEYIDQVGLYNPITKELRVEELKVKEWITKGVQPTDTVNDLFAQKKLTKPTVRSERKYTKKSEAKKA